MPGLDFLDGASAPDASTPAISDAPDTAITATPAAAPETTAQPEGPVRGPDGKFAAKTPAEPSAEPVQAIAPVSAPAAPQHSAEPQHAPITALLDERDKRQAAERERDELRAYRAQQERQRQAEPQEIPDPYEDPEGFQAYQQTQLDQRIYATNLQWSRRIAEVQHTPEVVGQAHEWGVARCNEDPFFNQKVQTSPDPYGFVIAEWKREQLLTGVQPDEFEQFRAWKASQGQGAPQPAAPAAPPAPAARPPLSLVSAPSAGGAAHVPSGPGQAYDRLFS